MSTRIVVADSSRARFFSMERSSGGMDEISDLMNPKARVHEADLTSDTDNRGRAPKGVGSHGPGNKPKIKAGIEEAFAQRLCQQLADEKAKGKFHKLYIAAPPRFLGFMRKHRTPGLDVAGELAKDLCACNPIEIRTHLPKYL